MLPIVFNKNKYINNKKYISFKKRKKGKLIESMKFFKRIVSSSNQLVCLNSLLKTFLFRACNKETAVFIFLVLLVKEKTLCYPVQIFVRVYPMLFMI